MTPERPPALAGINLGRHRHVCAFFDDRAEKQILLPFVADGLTAGDKVVLFVDDDLREEWLDLLGSAAIDVAAGTASGQLAVMGWEDTAARRGSFNHLVMLEFVRDTLASASAAGYPRTRLVGEMEWALHDPERARSWAEFEAGLEAVVRNGDDIVICVYDASRFGGGTIIDVLRTHPLTLLGGQLRENPFFMSPTDFLEELRSRRR